MKGHCADSWFTGHLSIGKRWLVFVYAFFVVSFVPAVCTIQAQELLFDSECDTAEHCFPSTIEHQNDKLLRSGAAIYRFWGFRVYAAALYRKNKGNAQPIFDDAFCLRLGYFREITGAQFEESSRSALKKEPQAMLQRSEATLKNLFNTMKAVKEGDVYQMCTAPDGQFVLLYNDTEIWKTVSKEFSRLYLSIWLGETSIHTSNRDKLIG